MAVGLNLLHFRIAIRQNYAGSLEDAVDHNMPYLNGIAPPPFAGNSIILKHYGNEELPA